MQSRRKGAWIGRDVQSRPDRGGLRGAGANRCYPPNPALHRCVPVRADDAVAGTQYVVDGLHFTAALDLQGNEVHLAELAGGATILDDVVVGFRASDLTYGLVGGAITIDSMTAEALDNTFALSGGVDPANPEQTLRLAPRPSPSRSPSRPGPSLRPSTSGSSPA